MPGRLGHRHIDDIAADSNLAQNLAPVVRAALVGQCAAVLTALVGGMISGDGLAVEAQVHEEDDRIITVAEAAGMMGYKESYVYELIRRGELLCIRHGKYVRLRGSSVNSPLKNSPAPRSM